MSVGPDAVAGVSALRVSGFEPIEEHTGALWVADLWPDEDKCSVADTRLDWLENEARTPHRVWLLRSLWPALRVNEVFCVLWTWIERNHEPLDAATIRVRVAEVLAWDESRAQEWHRRWHLDQGVPH